MIIIELLNLKGAEYSKCKVRVLSGKNIKITTQLRIQITLI